ncbi:hypothetical protein GCM10023190_22780 [Enteractinococcus fodinae]|uniref:Nucleoside 2-deoxyribosyltransferase n=1 Tax=Enteractinococcus fodinae TaxID=684663 RepID=A0ABU2B2Z3_9MICC|nr:DUF4062 domain-containing protein [Enteractinococcus fodinae]MDR7347962.1 nucleoside 2-deoxyribosyltransferase [Enteractinococcus fodinae]
MVDYGGAMSFYANVIKVLIASPSDTSQERDAVERMLHSWNSNRAETEKVILLPRRWETDAVPAMGGTGQDIINQQLVDKSDIVVALFGTRLGQPTENAISGTAEEIERAVAANKPVHVYFSDAPVPPDALEDAMKVREFQKKLQAVGLLGNYSDSDDLAYKVRNAVETDLANLNLVTPTQQDLIQTGADPIASFVTQPQNRFSQNSVRIRNEGDKTAEDLSFKLEPLDGGAPVEILNNSVGATIPGNGGEYQWPVARDITSTQQANIHMQWSENGEIKTRTHSISLI